MSAVLVMAAVWDGGVRSAPGVGGAALVRPPRCPCAPRICCIPLTSNHERDRLPSLRNRALQRGDLLHALRAGSATGCAGQADAAARGAVQCRLPDSAGAGFARGLGPALPRDPAPIAVRAPGAHEADRPRPTDPGARAQAGPPPLLLRAVPRHALFEPRAR